MQPTEADGARPADRSRAIAIATLALIAAVLLSSLLTSLHTSGVIADRYLVETLSYLVFWVPLVIAVAITTRAAWRVPLHFRWIDLLWGLGVGLLARAMSTVLELAMYGGAGTVHLRAPLEYGFGAMALFVATAFVAPLVLGPVIEELFFRGTVLGALRGTTVSSQAVAVAISSLVFALMHILGTSTPASALTVGLSTFLFALGAGTLAVSTNRLGGAITAHVVFNGSVIALAVAG